MSNLGNVVRETIITMNLLVIVKNDVIGARGSRQCAVLGVNVVNVLNLTSKYREAVL